MFAYNTICHDKTKRQAFVTAQIHAKVDVDQPLNVITRLNK